jgi:hypothetical protein
MSPRVAPRRRLAFVAITWLLLLACVEVVARVTHDGPPPSGDLSLDNEWRWAAARAAAGEGPETPYVHDPVTGWRNRPLLRLPGLTTNRLGARTSVEVTARPAPGRPRLLLVGDSYTFGQNVTDEETFGSVLATRDLPGWDVVNLGVPGTGTDQQLLMFLEHGRPLEPTVVVLGFFTRDYSRNLLSFRDYAKPRFELDGDDLRLTGTPVLSPEALAAEYATGERRVGAGVISHAIGGLLRAWQRRRIEWVDAAAPGWQVLARLMARFTHEVRAVGATPVWLLIPNRDAVEEGRSKYDELETLCAARATSLGLTLLSLTPALRAAEAAGARTYLPKAEGGHLSPAGHAVAAAELARMLRESGLAR